MNEKKDNKNVDLTRKIKKQEDKKSNNQKPEGQVDFKTDKNGNIFVELTQGKIRLTLPAELMLSFAQLSSVNKPVGFSVDKNKIATIVVGDVGINLDVQALQALGQMTMKALIAKQTEVMANKKIVTPDELMRMAKNNRSGGNKNGGGIII